jgi:hypothetical protein
MRWLAYFGLMIVALIVAVLVIGILAELPWWGLITSWMFIGIIAIWILTIADVWRRADMSPIAGIIWTIFIIIFPILTTIIYVFTRPGADKIRYKGDPVID